MKEILIASILTLTAFSCSYKAKPKPFEDPILLKLEHNQTPKKGIFVKFGEITGEVMPIEGTNLKYNLDVYNEHWHSELFAIDSNDIKTSYGIIVNWDEKFEDDNRERFFICAYQRLIVFNEEYDKRPYKTLVGENKILMDRFDPLSLGFFSTDNPQKRDVSRQAFIKNYWTKNKSRYVPN